MTPEDLAKQLAELHERTLTGLNIAIKQHKEYLHGLVQQAREELHSLASADQSSAKIQQVRDESVLNGDVPAAGAAVVGAKRRPAEAEEETEPAARPAKRRGRPPKVPKQLVIEEADEEKEEHLGVHIEQQLNLCGSQQHSVSVTVAVENDEATAEEAISAPAATRRRTTRAPAAAVSADDSTKPPSGRVTRSRHGAAADVEVAPAAASSGRSKRGRRAAAATAPAASQLEAIFEEDDIQPQEQHQTLLQDEEMHDAAAAAAVEGDDNVQGTAPESQQLQGQEGSEAGALVAPRGCSAAGEEAVQEQIGDNQTGAEEQAVADTTVPVAGDYCEGLELELVDHDKDNATCLTADNADQQCDSPAGVTAEGDAAVTLQQPAATEPTSSVRPVPKTPGFSLVPDTAQKHDSETPLLVGFASRTCTVCLPHETTAAADSTPPVRLDAAAIGSDVEQVHKTDSTSQRYTAGPKSLSFGQPLEAPLLQESPSGEADIASVPNPAVAADDSIAEQPAASGAMNWKEFMSTVHADAAPTPALMRQRQRSSAAPSYQQQQVSQGSTPAAAAAPKKESGEIAQQDAVSTPTAALAKTPEVSGTAAGEASSRRITRSSIKHHNLSNLQASPSDAAEAGGVYERANQTMSATPASSRKGKPARSPRPTPSRSAKHRPSAAKAAAEPAADQAKDGETAGQEQLEVTAPAVIDIASEPKQQEGHEAEDESTHLAQDSSPSGGKEAERREVQITDDEPALQHDSVPEPQDSADGGQPVATAVVEGTDADNADMSAVNGALAAQAASDDRPTSAGTNSGKATDSVSAWLAATAVVSSGAAGDKAKQQLEAAKDNKAASAGARSNLVSGIRSFVTAPKAPAVAPGKVKVKVKALEIAEAARRAEEAKAQERAARQQQPREQLGGVRPQGTPSGAMAQSRIAAVEAAVTGLSGSGGAVRVPAKQQEDEGHKLVDKEAAQKKAEKEAETAKRALDKAEREERMKRAEQKRKEEEQKRRQELAEKQRLREERAAAAAAARGAKAAAPKTAAAGARVADKAHSSKAKQPTAGLAASDSSNFKTPAARKATTRVGAAAAAAGGDGSAGASSDSPSLTIKLLEPVSTGGKAKNVMGPPAPLGGKTPAAFKTPAPVASEQEKRNVEALKNSPYVNTGIKRTPYSQQKPDPNSYVISPYRDDDVDTPDRSHKPIPDWARSHVLFEALKAQQHTDPDTIFGTRQTTCDLADLFADVPSAAPQQHQRYKVRKLGQRTSSADWSQDRLTWQEEVKYKKDMGYL